ncbi:MAG: hypothetical protein WDN76_06060 [Alphaproteobacteria bacterium]
MRALAAAIGIYGVASMAAPQAAHAEGRILVLSGADETAYRDAFAAADAGRWDRASDAVENVSDKTLVPTLQARRLTSGLYDPTYDELADWLNANADSAAAPEIYAMAQTRRPASAASLRAPTPLGRRSFSQCGLNAARR